MHPDALEWIQLVIIGNTFMRRFFLICALALCSQSFAFEFQNSHSCWEPTKPFQFNSQYEIDRFTDEVEDYKRCIEDFIETEEENIKKHQNAIQEAIDDWNMFVNFNLN